MRCRNTASAGLCDGHSETKEEPAETDEDTSASPRGEGCHGSSQFLTTMRCRRQGE